MNGMTSGFLYQSAKQFESTCHQTHGGTIWSILGNIIFDLFLDLFT